MQWAFYWQAFDPVRNLPVVLLDPGSVLQGVLQIDRLLQRNFAGAQAIHTA